MGKTFSPSRALGIPPQDYDAYFPEDVPAFNPDRGYSASPSMVTPYDAFANQFQSFAADQGLRTLGAQKDILNSDPRALVTPEGRDKRLGYVLNGAISPEQEHVIQDHEYEPPQHLTKYSPVPVEVAKAAAELDYIDPTEPGALEKRNQILRSVDEHPEWGGSNLKTHPYFQDKDQKFLQNYYAHKHLAGTAERSEENRDLSDIHKALTSGATADDLRPFVDEDFKRIKDRAGFSASIADAARRKAVLTPVVQKKLLELQLAAEQAASMGDNVPMKEAWLTSHGIDPASASAAQWEEAYKAIHVEPMQAFHNFQRSLGLGQRGAGPSVDAAPPTVPETAPMEAPPAAAPDATEVTTKEQFDALPSGATFMSNGKTYRKK